MFGNVVYYDKKKIDEYKEVIEWNKNLLGKWEKRPLRN